MDLVGFDDDYLERLKEGDPETEQHFVDYFTRLLRIKLSSRGVVPPDSEDIIQETFRRVLGRLAEIRSPRALGSYVNSVCNNVKHEHMRKRWRYSPLDTVNDGQKLSYQPRLEQLVLRKEQRQKVRNLLSKMSQSDRQLLQLLFLEGKSRMEVCRILNIGKANLRVRIHRMIKRVQEKLQEEERRV